MANWEFAAIVSDVGMWFLVKPAEVEPLRFTLSVGTDTPREIGPTFKWHHPMIWNNGIEESLRKVDRHNEAVRTNLAGGLISDEDAIKKRMEVKTNDLSEPNILYKSEDILTLVNMAGANGWEITGGLGLGRHPDGHPETRWRMMRREL